jgi:hypothetical protein
MKSCFLPSSKVSNSSGAGHPFLSWFTGGMGNRIEPVLPLGLFRITSNGRSWTLKLLVTIFATSGNKGS